MLVTCGKKLGNERQKLSLCRSCNSPLSASWAASLVAFAEALVAIRTATMAQMTATRATASVVTPRAVLTTR